MAGRLLIVVLMLIGAPWLAGCSTNPATGKRILTLHDWEWERRVGAEAAPQFTDQFGGEVPSPQLQSYVNGIGMRMTEVVEEGVPTLEWEFTLLNTDVINAFALPGGKVFFTRGLAEKLTNEAQMAGILGHEIGHVTARHGNQRVSSQTLFNVGLAGAAVAVGVADPDSDFRQYGQLAVPALAIGGNIVLLSYGRQEELEADKLGMRYMSRVGYDPVGQRQVMQILAEASGPSQTPEFLSTHPYPESRIEQIDKLLATTYAHTQNDPDYGLYAGRYEQQFLRVIDDLPPAPEPEQGRAPGDGEAVALGNPVLWCAHCAAVARDDSVPEQTLER